MEGVDEWIDRNNTNIKNRQDCFQTNIGTVPLRRGKLLLIGDCSTGKKSTIRSICSLDPSRSSTIDAKHTGLWEPVVESGEYSNATCHCLINGPEDNTDEPNKSVVGDLNTASSKKHDSWRLRIMSFSKLSNHSNLELCAVRHILKKKQLTRTVLKSLHILMKNP